MMNATPAAAPTTCLAMIADDLTGAMDAGVQVIRQGLRATVCLDGEHSGELVGQTDLVIIDTESRNASSHDASAAVRMAAIQARAAGARIIYKKIDSTLRGNVGAEIDALLSVGVVEAVVLAPALPGSGRTTTGGLHHVNGVRLGETEFAGDPFAPVAGSRIEDIVAAQSKVRTSLIGLRAVRLGASAVSACMNDAVTDGSGVIVVDAELDSDLECIAQALESVDAGDDEGLLLACGSAGLFAKMRVGRYAARLGAGSGNALPAGGRPVYGGQQAGAPAGHQVVVVSASPAEASRQQIEHALNVSPDLVPVYVDATVLEDGSTARGAVARLGEQVKDVVRSGRNLVLAVKGPGRANLLQSAGSVNGLRRRSAALLGIMAGLARIAVEHGNVGTLVLVGGDTARAGTNVLGARGIHILAEVEPYIPEGVIMGGAYDGLRVVTKAGGFGSEATLARIVSSVTQTSR